MDIKDVENLAELARIKLSDEEKRDLLKDMQGILEYVKQIERPGADVEAVPTAPNEFTMHNIWREDIMEPRDFSKELITEQFPDKQDGFLKVKKIL